MSIEGDDDAIQVKQREIQKGKNLLSDPRIVHSNKVTFLKVISSCSKKVMIVKVMKLENRSLWHRIYSAYK